MQTVRTLKVAPELASIRNIYSAARVLSRLAVNRGVQLTAFGSIIKPGDGILRKEHITRCLTDDQIITDPGIGSAIGLLARTEELTRGIEWLDSLSAEAEVLDVPQIIWKIENEFPESKTPWPSSKFFAFMMQSNIYNSTLRIGWALRDRALGILPSDYSKIGLGRVEMTPEIAAKNKIFFDPVTRITALTLTSWWLTSSSIRISAFGIFHGERVLPWGEAKHATIQGICFEPIEKNFQMTVQIARETTPRTICFAPENVKTIQLTQAADPEIKAFERTAEV
ncbi:MAG: hypothetical protein WC527_05280 [Candidatus Margulisiibacteriota bacterium]